MLKLSATLALSISLLSLTPALAMSKKSSNQSTSQPSDTAKAAQEDTLWVGKNDNAKSCDTLKGIGLDQAAQELQNSQISILSKKKIPDSMPRIQMCGADKGTKNGFLILKKDLEKASQIGFLKLDPQP